MTDRMAAADRCRKHLDCDSELNVNDFRDVFIWLSQLKKIKVKI
jgi:hypothetical protein